MARLVMVVWRVLTTDILSPETGDVKHGVTRSQRFASPVAAGHTPLYVLINRLAFPTTPTRSNTSVPEDGHGPGHFQDSRPQGIAAKALNYAVSKLLPWV